MLFVLRILVAPWSHIGDISYVAAEEQTYILYLLERSKLSKAAALSRWLGFVLLR
jgi:hypothetical protein